MENHISKAVKEILQCQTHTYRYKDLPEEGQVDGLLMFCGSSFAPIKIKNIYVKSKDTMLHKKFTITCKNTNSYNVYFFFRHLYHFLNLSIIEILCLNTSTIFYISLTYEIFKISNPIIYVVTFHTSSISPSSTLPSSMTSLSSSKPSSSTPT